MLKHVAHVLLALSLFLTGCAFDVAHVSFTRTVLTPQSDKSFKIREQTTIEGMPCWHNRTLFKDMSWSLIGAIPEGEVYKSKDQVLTVECSHVHEAYLVILQQSVVGFYLPVERGFVKLSKPITLNIE